MSSDIHASGSDTKDSGLEVSCRLVAVGATELLLVPQAKAAKRPATEAAQTPIPKRQKTTANNTSVGLSLSL